MRQIQISSSYTKKAQFFPQYEAITEEVLGEGVKQSAWNLQTIGTLPELRRHGLASALVQAVAEKVCAVLLQPRVTISTITYAGQGQRRAGDSRDRARKQRAYFTLWL